MKEQKKRGRPIETNNKVKITFLVNRDKHYNEWEERQDSERIAILDIIGTLEVKEIK